MSNIYDSYMDRENVIVSHDDHGTVVFDNSKILTGQLNRIYKNDNGLTNFVLSFCIGSGAVYYFGIKPTQIIINNSTKKMSIDAKDFSLISIDIDRKFNRYIMTIEAQNEKYTWD